MRYIDTSSITVPNDWLQLAKEQLGENYTSLWTYFRLEMEAIVGKKCWYSENFNIGTLNPIDHFRPKAARIKALTPKYALLDAVIWSKIDSAARNGYPFLEFEFSNYRYSCGIVNSSNNREASNNITRGKSNFFPLKLGSARCTNLLNIDIEESCLLDPCEERDPEYLTFDELGQIQPHISVLKDSWEYCRVVVSIEVYHLHYHRFIERRKELWDYCKERIRLANALYTKPNRTAEEEDSLIDFIKELNKKLKKESEFSAVAVDCIKYYKATYTWLDTLFREKLVK